MMSRTINFDTGLRYFAVTAYKPHLFTYASAQSVHQDEQLTIIVRAPSLESAIELCASANPGPNAHYYSAVPIEGPL